MFPLVQDQMVLDQKLTPLLYLDGTHMGHGMQPTKEFGMTIYNCKTRLCGGVNSQVTDMKYLPSGPICMHAHNHRGKGYTRIEPEYNLYHLVNCNH